MGGTGVAEAYRGDVLLLPDCQVELEPGSLLMPVLVGVLKSKNTESKNPEERQDDQHG